MAKGLNVTCVTSKDCLAAVVKGDADLAYASANDLVANGKSEDSQNYLFSVNKTEKEHICTYLGCVIWIRTIKMNKDNFSNFNFYFS